MYKSDTTSFLQVLHFCGSSNIDSFINTPGTTYIGTLLASQNHDLIRKCNALTPAILRSLIITVMICVRRDQQ